MLLNLGTGFSLPEEQWKDLANRIEEIVTGKYSLFAYPAGIEALAIRYTRKIIDYHGESQGGKIEDTFLSMKSELGLRPVYHQTEHRSDGRLFMTVMAYHVLHTIRTRLRSQGINDGWTTIRRGLSNHVRITTTLKRDDGKVIHIRKSSRPEAFHTKIYDALGLPHRPGRTVKLIQ